MLLSFSLPAPRNLSQLTSASFNLGYNHTLPLNANSRQVNHVTSGKALCRRWEDMEEVIHLLPIHDAHLRATCGAAHRPEPLRSLCVLRLRRCRSVSALALLCCCCCWRWHLLTTCLLLRVLVVLPPLLLTLAILSARRPHCLHDPALVH